MSLDGLDPAQIHPSALPVSPDDIAMMERHTLAGIRCVIGERAWREHGASLAGVLREGYSRPLALRVLPCGSAAGGRLNGGA